MIHVFIRGGSRHFTRRVAWNYSSPSGQKWKDQQISPKNSASIPADIANLKIFYQTFIVNVFHL
jgi:hypothetical protein